MQIDILYEASWRNSFLDGSNNESPEGGRKFIGSMTALKAKDKAGDYVNFISRTITLDTVMGVLNRLIGDQCKLYQTRDSEGYYFKHLEDKVSFQDNPFHMTISNEVVFLRNLSGSTDQNAFSGMIKASDPSFCSDYSTELWGVLDLPLDALFQFIANPDYQVVSHKTYDPLMVSNQLEQLGKEKDIPKNELKPVLDIFANHFSDIEYANSKEMVKPISLYCSALYLQLKRLAARFDMSTVMTAKGGLSGISKKGFTKKDFMKRYTTGQGKTIWGNPYLLKEQRKGEGEVTFTLTKACGRLEITLDISEDKAIELEQMIKNAGVSSFYLGKKGLAYVKKIYT